MLLEDLERLLCTENPVIPGRIQIERFTPVECFRKKGNTFRGIPFSRFFRNSRKFLYHLSTITSARLFPRGQHAMPMTADLSDESLLFQTVRDVQLTVVLFSRLLSTDSLQHNCSTQSEKDLSFGRRFLCFTFAFKIRTFELWRGKTLASETSNQMIRLNPFRFLGV